MKIRAYEQKDFDRLAEIHDAARKNELALANLSDAFVPFVEACENEGLFEYGVYVAECDGKVLGFIAFCAEEIAWLYVDVHHTREGIGTRLAEFALNKVNDDACIEVLKGNAPALALYTSLGFRIIETRSGVMPGNEGFAVTAHVLRRGER